MGLTADCIEKLAAIGVGGAALCFGDVSGAAGGLIGGVGLMAALNEAKRRRGLESKKLLDAARKAIGTSYEDFVAHDGREMSRADLNAADAAMAAHLLDCIPDMATLTALAQTRDRYPAAAAEHIVDRLAKKNAIFSIDSPSRVPLARDFALAVVEAALAAALKDTDYARDFLVGMATAMASEIAGLRADVVKGNAVGADTNAMVRQLVEAMQADKRTGTVSDEALITLANKIADKVTDPQQALAELYRAIDEFLRLRERAARGTNLGDLVDQALRNIAAANDRGDLDAGAKTGADAFADWQEQQVAAKAAGLRLIEANIEQQRLRFDAKEITHWIVERMALDSGPPDFYALCAEHCRWYELGGVHGRRLELDVAVSLAERMMVRASSRREQITARHALANACSLQGDRTGGIAGQSLQRFAVNNLEDILRILTYEDDPPQWIATMTSLGVALQSFGETNTAADSMATFDRSISIYEQALTLCNKKNMPIQWAMLQQNLGLVLHIKGKQLGGEFGIVLLERATVAFELALTVWTVETTPREWGSTQTNLGNSLRVRAGNSIGVAADQLRMRAIEVYESALSIVKRADEPFQWALIQSHLGNALNDYSNRQFGQVAKQALVRAVAAHQSALELYNHSQTPRFWATAQNNLGISLELLGLKSDSDEAVLLISRAVEAHEAALNVRTRLHMPADWADTQNNLGVALKNLSLCKTPAEGQHLMNRAIAAYGHALTVRQRDHTPMDWAATNENLAIARMAQANIGCPEDVRSYLEAARTAAASALAEYAARNVMPHREDATRLLSQINARLAALD